MWTGQPSTPDPYADVNVPLFTGCDYHNYNSKKNDVLNPGVYCGGLHFNGGVSVTLNDGTYIVDRSAMLVDGGATVTGNHVTFVFTSSTGANYPNVTINGGAIMNLGPPNSGTLSGIVMYADRHTPVGTNFRSPKGAESALTAGNPPLISAGKNLTTSQPSSKASSQARRRLRSTASGSSSRRPNRGRRRFAGSSP